MINLDYRFKEIREDLDLKQHEIAEPTHISRGSYANIESEISNVKLKYLLNYCNEFNFSLDYICKLTDLPCSDSLIPIKTIDKRVMAERLTIIEKENHKLAKDLANELGISKSTYSGYKNPKLPNLMQTLMLKRLALKYNYSIDWIVGRSNEKKRSPLV